MISALPGPFDPETALANHGTNVLRNSKPTNNDNSTVSFRLGTHPIQIWGFGVGTQWTQYRLYQRAKETGIGSTAFNEDRIRELKELGFVWALRGGEGKRDDDDYVSDHNNNNMTASDQHDVLK